MPNENVEALRRFYERWAVGDWTDASIFDPHAVGVMPDPSPVAMYGVEALGEYMRRFLDSWENVRIEAHEFREAGDNILVWVRLIARGDSSGVELATGLVHLWTFRGDKAIRFDVFQQESDALRAVGLPPRSSGSLLG